jgi:hypothetical protein
MHNREKTVIDKNASIAKDFKQAALRKSALVDYKTKDSNDVYVLNLLVYSVDL